MCIRCISRTNEENTETIFSNSATLYIKYYQSIIIAKKTINKVKTSTKNISERKVKKFKNKKNAF